MPVGLHCHDFEVIAFDTIRALDDSGHVGLPYAALSERLLRVLMFQLSTVIS
jgi:hypothetical protein